MTRTLRPAYRPRVFSCLEWAGYPERPDVITNQLRTHWLRQGTGHTGLALSLALVQMGQPRCCRQGDQQPQAHHLKLSQRLYSAQGPIRLTVQTGEHLNGIKPTPMRALEPCTPPQTWLPALTPSPSLPKLPAQDIRAQGRPLRCDDGSDTRWDAPVTGQARPGQGSAQGPTPTLASRAQAAFCPCRHPFLLGGTAP